MSDWNITPCGDIYQPPSRSNMSLVSIIELVIMGVVAVYSAIQLSAIFSKSSKEIGFLDVLNIIVDILIIAAIIYIIIGLFCMCGAEKIRMGIYLFALSGMLSMVLIIVDLKGGKDIFLKILYFIVILILTWILWNQASRLS